MRIIILKNCDTCRKALKALAEAGHAPEVIDLRADGISEGDLREIVAQLGAGAVNTRSTTWRGLDEAARATPPEALIAQHPTVMKRPAIFWEDGAVTCGWTKDIQARLA